MTLTKCSIKSLALGILDLPLRIVLTIVAVYMAADVWNIAIKSNVILDAIFICAFLRILIRLQCGFYEFVADSDDRTLLLNNFKNEIKFLLGFLAALYLTEYPLSKYAALTFVALNMILQFVPLSLSQIIRLSKTTRKIVSSKQSQIAALGLSQINGERTALIYGTGPKGKWLVDMLQSNPHSEILPIGFIDPHASGLWSYRDVPLIGGLGALRETILQRQVDLLFIAAEHKDHQHSQAVFEVAEQMGVPICVMPHIYDSRVSRCRLKMLNGQPALVYSSATEESLSTLVKSILDRSAAAFGLLVLSPMLLATAAIIKKTSDGPVLFKQKRLGQNGAPFNLLKFRSMYKDAEARKKGYLSRNEMSGPVFKITDDPRITPFGRFIRKYSIDELPQLINVLKGEMSLVGPRPALPEEVSKFSPWQRRKLAVKPGVTCIWQVSGRNEIDFENWMKLDLEYIDNWSLWLDTKILARTIPTVLKGTGR